ncbi:hypothetical protein SpAn4DRAFT_1168 [Sporomusa ovata]|uniref:Uncharacterized protein n=1 Tax=Sporomusa ovata TaxID=2378 RepID=A0A0U1L4U7_9FIRM|nr:hypothetical protein SpAn4DRAFT_1168 [Sporomusa ovata]
MNDRAVIGRIVERLHCQDAINIGNVVITKATAASPTGSNDVFAGLGGGISTTAGQNNAGYVVARYQAVNTEGGRSEIQALPVGFRLI